MRGLRMRAAAFLAVVAALAMLAAWLLLARGTLPIETDLLAMLPATERDALAETALERLANANGDRMVLVLAGSDEDAKSAARMLGAELESGGAFASVTAELPPTDLDALVAPYLAHRFGLLAREDRATLAAGNFDVAAALRRALNQPFVGAVTVPLAEDPFGWLERWLGEQPWSRSPLMPEDDLLVAHQGDTTHVLVLATLEGSAYDDAVQKRSLTALDAAWQATHARHPDVRLLRTGAVFHAAAARAGAERDMRIVGWIAGLGISLLLVLVFRSPGPLGVAFLSTLVGIITALAVSLLVFERIFLLTFVFGAALLGEAVDYSIQYLTARANAGADWDAARGARQVRPALLIALGTSLLGYALLGLVPFPPLRQMAVFALSGMLAACLSVLWLLPALLRRPARPLPAPMVRAARALERALGEAARGRRAIALIIVALALAAPGWLRLDHDDDIHLLISPPADLVADEARIRDITGLGNGTQFFLVRGDTLEQALEHEEALAARLDVLVDEGRLPGYIGLAGMAPSQARQAENRARIAPLFANPDALRTTLVEAGFRADAAAAYVAAWPGTPIRFEDFAASDLARPFVHLRLDAAAGGPATIVLPQEAEDIGALRDAADGLPGVVLVDKPHSVSELFGRYRRYASLWLLAAIALIVPVFGWRYGAARMVRVATPPVAGLALTLAVLGYLGHPLTLFHWLALMLVLGVGANYAVFLFEGETHTRERPGAIYASVLLSALTAQLSFGLLALSSMPALASFGVTLLFGIGFTALIVPMCHERVRGSGAHTGNPA